MGRDKRTPSSTDAGGSSGSGTPEAAPATQPVLAKVQRQVRIGDHSYKVTYESHDHVQALMKEFMEEECRGKRKKPGKDGKSRRFFRCKWCKKDDFANKWALNHHRFLQGCPAMEGKKLHPYPDMETGQGKISEMYRAATPTVFTATRIPRKRSRSKSAGKQSRRKKPASPMSDEDAVDDTADDSEETTDDVDLNVRSAKETVHTRSKERERVLAAAGKGKAQEETVRTRFRVRERVSASAGKGKAQEETVRTRFRVQERVSASAGKGIGPLAGMESLPVKAADQKVCSAVLCFGVLCYAVLCYRRCSAVVLDVRQCYCSAVVPDVRQCHLCASLCPCLCCAAVCPLRCASVLLPCFHSLLFRLRRGSEGQGQGQG